MWNKLFEGCYQFSGDTTDILLNNPDEVIDETICDLPEQRYVHQVNLNSKIRFNLPNEHGLTYAVHKSSRDTTMYFSPVKCFHYKVGGFMAEHSDTCRSGTLIYIPAGNYTGGVLTLLNGDRGRITFPSSDKDVLLFISSFVRHEVSRVESGVRISYTSRVYFIESDDVWTTEDDNFINMMIQSKSYNSDKHCDKVVEPLESFDEYEKKEKILRQKFDEYENYCMDDKHICEKGCVCNTDFSILDLGHHEIMTREKILQEENYSYHAREPEEELKRMIMDKDIMCYIFPLKSPYGFTKIIHPESLSQEDRKIYNKLVKENEESMLEEKFDNIHIRNIFFFFNNDEWLSRRYDGIDTRCDDHGDFVQSSNCPDLNGEDEGYDVNTAYVSHYHNAKYSGRFTDFLTEFDDGHTYAGKMERLVTCIVFDRDI